MMRGINLAARTLSGLSVRLGAIRDRFGAWTPEEHVQMQVEGFVSSFAPGYSPGFTPTEARKLADALYAAALEVEQEIDRRKLRVVRDPDGAVGTTGGKLWYAAIDGVIRWEYAGTEDEARTRFLSDRARTPLQVGRGISGRPSAARYRCFAELLEARP